MVQIDKRSCRRERSRIFVNYLLFRIFSLMTSFVHKHISSWSYCLLMFFFISKKQQRHVTFIRNFVFLYIKFQKTDLFRKSYKINILIDLKNAQYVRDLGVNCKHAKFKNDVCIFGILWHYIAKKYDIIFWTWNFWDFWAL